MTQDRNTLYVFLQHKESYPALVRTAYHDKDVSNSATFAMDDNIYVILNERLVTSSLETGVEQGKSPVIT